MIGTPVDEHLNPDYGAFKRFFDEILALLHDDQHVILRSTVFPGTTKKVDDYLKAKGLKTKVSFCPERIAEGQAMAELHVLPQIVAAFEPAAVPKQESCSSSSRRMS